MMNTKRDLNQIAAIEKAISDKYGKETIQNPRSSWSDEKEKEYLQQIKSLSKKELIQKVQFEKVIIANGYLVEKKLLNKDNKRSCPICKEYSFKSRDDLYILKFDCCYKCYIQYVEGREKRWLSGWRPNSNED